MEFPAKLPTLTEISQLLGRLGPKVDAARSAGDSGKPLGLVGIAVGVVGVLVGAVALLRSRRPNPGKA